MGSRWKGRELHWRDILEQQAVSGLSVAGFCRQESISAPSFYSWRRRLRERDARPRPEHAQVDGDGNPGPQLFPIRIESSASPASVRVLLPQGVSLDVPSGIGSSELTDLLRALREASVC